MKNLTTQRWTLWGSLLYITILLFSLGCTDNKKQSGHTRQPQRAAITIKMVTQRSLRATTTQLLKAFQQEMASQQSVRFENTILPSYSDVDDIASGKQKNDLWITPSLFGPAWSDTHLENLGTKQRECTSYGQSPIKPITTIELASKVCDQDGGCLWGSFIEYLQNSTPYSKTTYDPMLLFSPPSNGPVDTLAWANLFEWERVDLLKGFSEQTLPAMKKNLRWLSIPSLSLPSYHDIFQRIAHTHKDEYVVVVASEATLLAYLKTAGEPERKRLIPLPLPEENTFTEDYTACISGGDWVTPEKLSVLSQLKTFLGGATAKAILKENGYHAPSPDKNDKNQNKEVTGTEYTIRDFAHQSWDALRKPSALLLALDTSASLEENGKIYDVKRLARMLVATEPKDSAIALMSFADTSKILSNFSSPRKHLLEELDDIQPIGGSAVYDAISSAFEHLRKSPEGHTKRLLFITDGGDINSRLLKDQIVLLANRRPEWREGDFIIVGVQDSTKPVDFSDLKEITTAANGRFLEVPSQKLSEYLHELGSP